jgi:hypothetical protein
MTPFPKADPSCDHCDGNGFIISTRVGYGVPENAKYDGCLAVERCDQCLYHGQHSRKTVYDAAVARHAKAEGLNCRLIYPCVLLCPGCGKPFQGEGCCGHTFDDKTLTFKQPKAAKGRRSRA